MRHAGVNISVYIIIIIIQDINILQVMHAQRQKVILYESRQPQQGKLALEKKSQQCGLSEAA